MEYSAILKIEGAIDTPPWGIDAGRKPFESNDRMSLTSIRLGIVSLSNTPIWKPSHKSSKMGFLKPWHVIVSSCPLIEDKSQSQCILVYLMFNLHVAVKILMQLRLVCHLILILIFVCCRNQQVWTCLIKRLPST